MIASCYKSIGFGEDDVAESVEVEDTDSFVFQNGSDDPNADPTDVETSPDTGSEFIDTDSETVTPVTIPGGVDILIVVDNSISMGQEQSLLSAAIFTLMNELLSPLDGSAGLTSVRVGVTTTDMGLQYGWERELTAASINGCFGMGNDGKMKAISEYASGIEISNGLIPCSNAATHCPSGFSCDDGVCNAEAGVSTVSCPSTTGRTSVETTVSIPNTDLALQAACLINQGIEGCGIEQQLSAATRALTVNPGFLVEAHHLMVMILTDEDDCSVKDPAFFQTREWVDMSGSHSLQNVACAFPEENGAYLFTAEEIRNFFIEMKNGNPDAVFYTAIVGVPDVAECQGAGTTLFECFDRPEMEPTVIYPPLEGYALFAPACTRVENGEEVTNAVPGWRFVEMAELFGDNGSIYSICRSNWAPFMDEVAERIRIKVEASTL